MSLPDGLYTLSADFDQLITGHDEVGAAVLLTFLNRHLIARQIWEIKAIKDVAPTTYTITEWAAPGSKGGHLAPSEHTGPIGDDRVIVTSEEVREWTITPVKTETTGTYSISVPADFVSAQQYITTFDLSVILRSYVVRLEDEVVVPKPHWKFNKIN